MSDINLQTGSYTFAKNNDFTLESGKSLGPVTLAYETYGHLNDAKDNMILICHALTGNAHVAGSLPGEEKPTGWWDPIIGPGKPLDTSKYFIVCSNILGGCSGSSGPSSINPETKKPYGMDFPIVTIRDMVKAQYHLITDHFKVESLYAVIGGSIGGMQVLEWAIQYPDIPKHIIPIATTTKLSSQALAFNKIGRHAIMIDPTWEKGHYYDKEEKAIAGLGLARMVAHITYLSEEGMQHKFGRDRTNESDMFSFDEKFQVENYLDHQGDKFITRFDANSYLYLSKSMDLYDLTRGYKDLKEAVSRIKAKILSIYSSSDWLFPEYQALEFLEQAQELDKDIISFKIESVSGHDAFLTEYDKINPIIDSFLN